MKAIEKKVRLLGESIIALSTRLSKLENPPIPLVEDLKARLQEQIYRNNELEGKNEQLSRQVDYLTHEVNSLTGNGLSSKAYSLEDWVQQKSTIGYKDRAKNKVGKGKPLFSAAHPKLKKVKRKKVVVKKGKKK